MSIRTTARRLLLPFAMAIVLSLVSGPRLADAQVAAAIKAAAPAARWVLKELAFDQIKQRVIDPITGAVSVSELDARLEELEKNAALRDEVRDKISLFRRDLARMATKDELERGLSALRGDIVLLEKRVTKNEATLQIHEVRLADHENGTSAAADPQVFVRRGDSARLRGDFYESQANYTAALQVNGNCTEAYLGRARLYLEKGAAEIAAIDYEAAAGCDGSNVEAQIGLATTGLVTDDVAATEKAATAALVALPALAVQREEDRLLRHAALRVVGGLDIHVSSDRADAHFIRAVARVRAKNWRGAKEDLDTFLSSAPRSAAGLHILSWVLLEEGQMSSATAKADEALQVARHPLFLVNRAEIHRRFGECKEALDLLSEAEQFDSDSSNGRQVATAYRKPSELGVIARHFHADGLPQWEGDVSNYMLFYRVRGLCRSYSEIDDNAGAEADLRRAIQLGDNDFLTEMQLGHALHLLKEYGDSEVFYNRALKHPNLSNYNTAVGHYFNAANNNHFSGWAKLAGEHADKALVAYAKVAAEDRDDELHARMYWEKAQSCRDLEDVNGYVSAVESMLRLDPDKQGRLKGGYVRVFNDTDRKVKFVPDEWWTPTGDHTNINNFTFFGYDYTYTFDPGERSYLSYKGHPVYAKRYDWWVVAGGKDGAWKFYNYSAGPWLDIVITKQHLP